MNTTRWVPLAGATGVLAIGIAAVVGSLDLGYWKAGPGPGFFPLWLGILLSVLALFWVVQVLRAAPASTTGSTPEREPDSAPDDEPDNEPADEPAGGRQVVLVLAGLVALVPLLDLFGYQLSMSLFVLYVLLVVSRRKPVGAVVIAVLAGFGVYALFANVLQVYLPTASLGFLAQLGL
jgi:putative tricarboxylic transport membrane protein